MSHYSFTRQNDTVKNKHIYVVCHYMWLLLVWQPLMHQRFPLKSFYDRGAHLENKNTFNLTIVLLTAYLYCMQAQPAFPCLSPSLASIYFLMPFLLFLHARLLSAISTAELQRVC